MKTLKNIAYVAALGLVAGMAHAESPLPYYGDIGLGVGRDWEHSTDDGTRGSVVSSSLQGYIGTEYMGWRGAADFYVMNRGDHGESSFDSFGPTKTAAFGLHAGHDLPSNAYAGVFAGKNWFQGSDVGSTNGYVGGWLAGVEGEMEVAPGSTIYGQFGYAHMKASSDTAFQGKFAKAGYVWQRDKLALRVEGEWGYSGNVFEDDKDWGKYTKISLGGEYEIRPDLMATATLSQMDITANSEDTGYDKSIQLGVKWNFGGAQKPYNLRTPYTPGLAAAWAETLD